jgi:hypothetical protein
MASLRLLLVITVLTLAAPSCTNPITGPSEISDGSNPSIWFTSVPSIGSFADLKGSVSDVQPSTHRVVVYILVSGTWWIKPFFGSLTSIESKGTWTCDITTGGHDESATRIAAYVVSTGYVPADNTLPAAGSYIATVTVTR